MCHEHQTRRRNAHTRRFRHIFVVDPGFVVARGHSRALDQPQDPDQPQQPESSSAWRDASEVL
jgi:hypothetical protein